MVFTHWPDRTKPPADRIQPPPGQTTPQPDRAKPKPDRTKPPPNPTGLNHCRTEINQTTPPQVWC